jgi:hypothetical protein
MDTNTQEEPRIGRRRREAHPERIALGDKIYERNDVAARKYFESERSLNRRDKKGAPYQFFGGVKYRPQPDCDNFILAGIQVRKPPSPKRKTV